MVVPIAMMLAPPGIVLLVLLRLAWCPAAGMVPKSMRRAAWVVLGFAVLWIMVRTLVTRTWLPSSMLGVVWFAAAELFLVPIGLSLLLLAWVSGHWRSIADRAPATSLAAAMAVGYLALLVFLVLPAASRGLDWGRYGLGPPVEMREIGAVSRETGLWFPTRTVLVDAGFTGGTEPTLIAMVRLRHEDLDSFLSRQPFAWQDRMPDGGSRYYPSEIRSMTARGWHPDQAHRSIWAQAVGPRGLCRVLVDLDNPSAAIVYVSWDSLK
jgi:hypothetical protein